MGGLSETRQAKARAGRASAAARRARDELRRRGVAVRLRELGRRSLAECIDAINWANNRRPIAVRPAWIGELLDEGRARLLAGVCLACGDTGKRNPELVWATVDRTICEACFDPVHRARPTVGDRLRARGWGGP